MRRNSPQEFVPMRFLIPVLALSLASLPVLAQTTAPATPAPSSAPAAAAPAASANAPPATGYRKGTRTTRTTFQQRFDAANTTHDGKLTKDQAQAARMYSTVKNWDAIDKDKKGYVTADDLKAYAAAQRAAHHTGTGTTKPPA
jgi:hypothetical protein